jgi:hypothetical protein
MHLSKWAVILAWALSPLASLGWTIFPDDRMVPDKSTPELVAMFEEFKASADKGDVNAQFKLGFCYYIGCGVPARDYKLAIEWYRKAAEAGLADAQFALGSEYGGASKVLEKDPDLSLKWITKAAAQKYPKAYHSLGASYELGIGVPKDEIEGYAYYNLAAPYLAWSRRSRDDMEKSMSAEQRLAGQRRSKEILKELESKK